jgi:hypothetical protein
LGELSLIIHSYYIVPIPSQDKIEYLSKSSLQSKSERILYWIRRLSHELSTNAAKKVRATPHKICRLQSMNGFANKFKGMILPNSLSREYNHSNYWWWHLEGDVVTCLFTSAYDHKHIAV